MGLLKGGLGDFSPYGVDWLAIKQIGQSIVLLKIKTSTMCSHKSGISASQCLTIATWSFTHQILNAADKTHNQGTGPEQI